MYLMATWSETLFEGSRRLYRLNQSTNFQIGILNACTVRFVKDTYKNIIRGSLFTHNTTNEIRALSSW